jgi:ceramide glucosyltransferase
MILLACLAALLAGVGSLVVLAEWRAVRALPAAAPLADVACPGISVLRPLHGDEPLLEAALLSACQQDYPEFQVVFGVQDAADKALAVVERVRARLPERDIAVVCDNTADGANRKVANLSNMLAAARHDVLVIADSDMHASPDYLRAIASALAEPGTGLVTTLYTGLPASRTLAATLCASGITHGFLPGAAMARRLGRLDCLGATMALRRETLATIGGFASLIDELADDNVLGRLVQARGLRIGLAATIPATTVPETTLPAMLRHELRWARTIRSLTPQGFAVSAVQYPLAWATFALLLSAGAAPAWGVMLPAWGVMLAAWVVRAVAAHGVDAALARRAHLPTNRAPLFLLPLRDLMSFGVWLAAYAGDRVEWRGRVMRARRVPPRPAAMTAT